MTRPDLIAAVLADPDALWAVLTSGVKVAGAWELRPHAARRLGTVPPLEGRGEVAGINEASEPRGMWFGWVVGGAPTTHNDSSTAKAWCDARLREAGYLLASGEP